MINTAALGKATRAVGKLFFASLLLLVAAVIGFGGTALFVFHQFGADRRPVAPPSRGALANRAVRTASDGKPAVQAPATSSDRSQYLYVANTGGYAPAASKQPRPAINVPPPLGTTAQTVDASDSAVRLNDPESHYITDSRTGRVIGIDGSAGARRESEERLAQVDQTPRAIAVQTPSPEVRVASAVVEDGMPVYDGKAAPRVSVPGSQYTPVRKALPVTSDDTDNCARVFNAGEYRYNEDNRPVLRAQAIVPVGARVVKTLRVYRLPDGTQMVAAD